MCLSVCSSVCLSVCYKPAFCQNNWTHHHARICSYFAHFLHCVAEKSPIKQSLILQITFYSWNESETSDPPLESPSSAPVNPAPHAVSESVKYIGGFSGRLERPERAFILNSISSTWYWISAIVNSCNTPPPSSPANYQQKTIPNINLDSSHFHLLKRWTKTLHWD